MKRIILMMMILGAAFAAQAVELSASADFASAYVFRGATLNDGFVFQPGAEISSVMGDEKYGSLALGIWGNYDIDDEDGDGSDFSEVDYYLAYSLPIEVIDVGVSYTEYSYPNGGGSTDREIALSLGSDISTNGLSTSVSFNYGVDGAIDKDLYTLLALDYETSLTDALSASAGVSLGILISDSGDDGFNDATVSAGLGYALGEHWALNGGLTYIAQLDDDVLSDEAYDVNFVATVGVGCEF